MSIENTVADIADKAQLAKQQLIALTAQQKNKILSAMAQALLDNTTKILQQNARDVELAKEKSLSAALIDRLLLTKQRVAQMAEGMMDIAKLEDPINELLSSHHHDNGMIIKKVRVPIGVIAMIYEARPNVTADVAALCLKTSNAVILKGGAESFYSNTVISDVLVKAGVEQGMPQYAVQLIPSTDRGAVKTLVQQMGKVDLAIPRGGEGLINAVNDMAKVPVIKHYKGLCHAYVDKDADVEMAVTICENAKCQRPGVCNAMETLLVHKDIATSFLPPLIEKMQKNNVELLVEESVNNLLGTQLAIASNEDWDKEYLDLILSIKLVASVDDAIAHINKHGSHHSDTVISDNKKTQQQFLNEIDSAAVYVNASTRFTDGSVFGMGAEMGISTDKIHARGPMGLCELTSYKYVIVGDGQVRL